MPVVTHRTYAPTTVRQLKQETRVRTRVVFDHPNPITADEKRFPFIETGVQQWPSDHPTRPNELYVTVADVLIRTYQLRHPQFEVFTRLWALMTDERLWLPLLPKGEDRYRSSLSNQIHFDNTGWRFGEAPDESLLWMLDPTADSGEPVEAQVRWEQHDHLHTKIMIVALPPGLAERSRELVSKKLADVRQQFVDEWLGGPEEVRRMLGLA